MTSVVNGSLKRDIDAFLGFKRARGYPYVRSEGVLRAFDRFVVAACAAGPQSLRNLIETWVGRSSNRKPVSVGIEHSVIRQFCLHRRRHDEDAYVPARGSAPSSKGIKFLPYIFKIEEVRDLLRLASNLRRTPFRGLTFRTLILILYCTGLRFGEALRLRVQDVDLERNVLFVDVSKGRSRWVPFHKSLRRELKKYLTARANFAPMSPNARVFVGCNRLRLPYSTANFTMCGLLRAAGVKPRSGRCGPRPYDLRHTFAVHRLTAWYRARIDVPRHLAWLSAYMGHNDLLGTESYLNATPELLRLAARRLHRKTMSTVRVQ